MRTLYRNLLVLSVLSATGSLAAPRIELEPVLTSGLTYPIYATHARDGSGRLFIVEQPGRIKIFRPGVAGAKQFLDLSSKVVSGGEQGLLGLAFHPQYRINRRFFVNYTRVPDGATVISEFQTSSADPDIALTEETVILTIAQPYANHNGGMIEFGPDGYLYIGTGDGGSANDPDSRSQDPRDLLGKILRIDVDQTSSERAYVSPATNPFAAAGGGRDEVYALGLRNPWRFSFDRISGQLLVGDVGQNAIEEIDVVRLGGNYGWRVFEGTRCTNLGPAACISTGYVPPIAEYAHTQGRCSVTGGYVYRGARSSLPIGAYVYGDFCSGEIFMLSGGTGILLLDTDISIASFGEDEAGEIYVVGLGGTVHKIVNPDAPPLPTLYFPRLFSSSTNSPGQNEHTGFAAVNLDDTSTRLSFMAFDQSGFALTGAGITNPRSIELRSGEQLALVDTQIFGDGLASTDAVGWASLESSTARVAAFSLSFNEALDYMDGADSSAGTLISFVFPEVESRGETQIRIANPGPESVALVLELVSADGSARGLAERTIPGGGLLAQGASDLFPGHSMTSSDYIRGGAAGGVISSESLWIGTSSVRVLNGQDATAGARTLYCPQYAVGDRFLTTLSIVNLDSEETAVTLRFHPDNGTPSTVQRELRVAGRGKIEVRDPQFFGDFGAALTQGYVEILSSGARLTGSVSFGDAVLGEFAASMPLVTVLGKRLVYAHVASDATYFTGIAVVNPNETDASVLIEVFDSNGSVAASRILSIAAGERRSNLLTEYFPELVGRDLSGGHISVSADIGVASFALFGTHRLKVLAAIPPAGRLP